MLKIALAQLNFHVGNIEGNRELISNSIEKAKRDGVDLIIFPELSVCGCPPLDLLKLKDFNDKCKGSVDLIAQMCTGIAAIVGGTGIYPDPLGKKLYNSAFFLNGGRVQSVVNKVLLSNYDVFDEYRYFEPCREFKLIDFKGYRIAITIGDDLRYEQPSGNPCGSIQPDTNSPMDELAKLRPDFIVNIAAFPFAYNKNEIKKRIFAEKAARYKIPLFHVNQVGANTDLIFDGGSMVVGANGQVINGLDTFREDYGIYDLASVISGNYPPYGLSIKDDVENIYDALVLGIRDYLYKSAFTKATLGLSGGIDSAVTAVLAVAALGKENVRVLLMPSQHSSEHSVFDAIALSEKLGIRFDIIPIHDVYHQFESTFRPLFAGLAPDTAEENIQARIRGIMLMSLSNKFGHALLNTCNKSEIAMGYGTLYGDMNGSLAVLGDVYKTRVYELAHFINRHKEVIPENTILKPPSAELRPGQVDSDTLPAYDVLDQILYYYLEEQLSSGEITRFGFDGPLVNAIIQVVNRNEYKRFQIPPILRISSKAFGSGRRMPIVAKY